MWFSDKLPEYHNGSGLQGRPFHQSIIIVELITDDFQGVIDWYISEKTDVKANKSMSRLKVNRLE
jgi:hypothetical protein